MTRVEITIAVAAAALAIGGTPACDGQLPQNQPAPDAGSPVDTRSTADGSSADLGPHPPPIDAMPGVEPSVDEEGLPFEDSGAPQVSASCTFVNTRSGAATTASWDAGTRTFRIGNLYWKLDARGAVVEYGQSDGQWRHVIARDGYGMTTTFIYEWEHGVSADNSWDQTNQYDADGRVTSSVLVYRSGTRRQTYEYVYVGDHLSGIVSRQESGGTTSESWSELFWTGDKLTARAYGFGGTAISRQTRFYDDAGRLIGIEQDGGGIAPRIDGTADIRIQWTYDSAGRVASFMQDGTEALDNPVVDGIPDDFLTFDAACAQIAALPLKLYLMPSWLRLR